MTEKQIIEKLKYFTTGPFAVYGPFGYQIEFVQFKIEQLYHLLITNRGHTKNVLSEIRDLKQWNTVDKGFFDQMDALFRWESVDNGRQLIAFEVKEHEVRDEEGVVMVYLLMDIDENIGSSIPKNKNDRGGNGNYVGLRFKRNYSNLLDTDTKGAQG